MTVSFWFITFAPDRANLFLQYTYWVSWIVVVFLKINKGQIPTGVTEYY